jgi:hypothetical protein
MRASVFKEMFYPMARQAHLEAAKYHLDAARMHLEAAGKYHEGDRDAAEMHSHEAWAAAKVAEDKSTEAHGESMRDARARVV